MARWRCEWTEWTECCQSLSDLFWKTSSILSFSLIFINPIIRMWVVGSKLIVTDLGGYVNVHSTPLIVTMDNAAFSVMLTSEIRQLPVVCWWVKYNRELQLMIWWWNWCNLLFDEIPHEVYNKQLERVMFSMILWWTWLNRDRNV